MFKWPAAPSRRGERADVFIGGVRLGWSRRIGLHGTFVRRKSGGITGVPVRLQITLLGRRRSCRRVPSSLAL
jgi:hypothetical protein